jgi:hypothetical protein
MRQWNWKPDVRRSWDVRRVESKLEVMLLTCRYVDVNGGS